MDKKQLFNAIDEIDDSFLLDTEKEIEIERKSPWKMVVASGILAVSVAALIIFVMVNRINNRIDSDNDKTVAVENESVGNVGALDTLAEPAFYSRVIKGHDDSILLWNSSTGPVYLNKSAKKPEGLETGDYVAVYGTDMTVQEIYPGIMQNATEIQLVEKGNLNDIPSEVLADLFQCGHIDLPEEGNIIDLDSLGEAYKYGDISLLLKYDGTFQCTSEDPTSSFIKVGTWTQDGDMITIIEYQPNKINKFRKTDKYLIWIADGSDGLSYVHATDGAKFKRYSFQESVKEEKKTTFAADCYEYFFKCVLDRDALIDTVDENWINSVQLMREHFEKYEKSTVNFSEKTRLENAKRVFLEFKNSCYDGDVDALYKSYNDSSNNGYCAIIKQICNNEFPEGITLDEFISINIDKPLNISEEIDKHIYSARGNNIDISRIVVIEDMVFCGYVRDMSNIFDTTLYDLYGDDERLYEILKNKQNSVSVVKDLNFTNVDWPLSDNETNIVGKMVSPVAYIINMGDVQEFARIEYYGEDGKVYLYEGSRYTADLKATKLLKEFNKENVAYTNQGFVDQDLYYGYDDMTAAEAYERLITENHCVSIEEQIYYYPPFMTGNISDTEYIEFCESTDKRYEDSLHAVVIIHKDGETNTYGLFGYVE